VPETQLETQPELVPSSIPPSYFTSVQYGIDREDEDGWQSGRSCFMNYSTETRENWTEGHRKGTVTWMDTQASETSETDDDSVPDLIQIAE
jgi:hypothetical protein